MGQFDPEHEAALRRELEGLELSPDRDAKFRRMTEIRDQLGEPQDAADRAPRERAVPRKAGA